MNNQAREAFLGPLINNNPVTLQVLGICSALAVTTSLVPALLMCAALTSVATLGNVSVSLIRHHIPRQYPHHHPDNDYFFAGNHR